MLLNDSLAFFFKTLQAQNASSFAVLALGLISCAIAVTAAYNIWLHPLSNYPGPKLAAASRIWYCYHSIRGDFAFIIRDLHEHYGHVVRVAPDELSYTDPDGWNDIYGHRPGKPEVMKDPLFYSNLSSGQGSIINADRSRHGLLRKQMSHGFSERALRGQEETIRSFADLFVRRLNENSAGGTAAQNMVMWFNFFTFDVMGELVFGESFNCLESSAYHPWVKLIFDSVKIGALLRCSKTWPLLHFVGAYFIPKELQQRHREQKAMARAKGDNRKALKTERLDLISGFLKPDSETTDQEYQATVETLIIAGSETTATLMSGFTYYLLQTPSKMEKIVTEIRTAFSSADDINFMSATNLPYLMACLNETLRIYPPVVDGFPRNTGWQNEVICGKIVPLQTVVKIPHFATFNSTANFARPDEFVPERWLDDPAFTDDKKHALQPFNVGPRNCLGRNLALMEMRLLLSLLLWHFDLELMEESKNWKEQKAYLLWEKPDLMVKLTPRIIET